MFDLSSIYNKKSIEFMSLPVIYSPSKDEKAILGLRDSTEIFPGSILSSSSGLLVPVPKGFRLALLRQQRPPVFKYTFRKGNFLYILRLMTELRTKLDYRYETTERNPWIPINAETLVRIVWNYKDYLTYLIDNRVLECDNWYEPGTTSRRYRWCSDYFNGENQEMEYEWLKDYKVLARIEQLRQHKNTQGRDIYPVLEHWLHKVEIDSDEAIKAVNVLLQNSQEKNKEIKAASYLFNIEGIQKRQWFFTVDNKAGRLHTNLTNLPKWMRSMIKLEGESLVGMDIRNSQPYLLALLLNKEFYEEKEEQNGKGEIRIKDIISKSNIIQDYKEELNKAIYVPMLGFLNEMNDNQDFIVEKENYRKLVSEGNLYEYILRKAIEIPQYMDYGRDQVKKLLMTIFYSDDAYPNEAKHLFSDSFPYIAGIIHDLKQLWYQHAPILLQTLEAVVVLDRIVGRIIAENPQVPLFTVHDSVVTTPFYCDYVQAVMEEELTLAIGLKPNIKPEYWSEQSTIPFHKVEKKKGHLRKKSRWELLRKR